MAPISSSSPSSSIVEEEQVVEDEVEENIELDHHHHLLLLSSTASISLSLSSLLSKPPSSTSIPLSNYLPTPPYFLLPPPSRKTQIPSFLSLSNPPSPHPKIPRKCNSLRSSFATCPSVFLSPLRPLPDPSALFALRRTTIVLFRNDLRIHDNDALASAHSDSLSLLPLFCFDPRDFGKSPSGFDRTGPFRASFLLQSVSDLRRSLRSRGSDLLVRLGRPESLLVELARASGADAVYLQREVSPADVRSEERIEAALKDEGVDVKFFWGSTLYHVDDLPFKLENMPSNYGGFRAKVQGLEVRKPIQAPEQIKGLPSRGNIEVGEIPTLADLGLNPAPTIAQDGKVAANASLVGGETEALQKLQKFAAECNAQPNKAREGGQDNTYGANFSCKISPWLAMGCLSPRYMFEALKKTATRISAGPSKKDGDDGMNWLMYELIWRDFFRFITKKYSSTKKTLESTPATACTGTFA